MDNTEPKDKFRYEIKQQIGTLGKPSPKGWTRELNLVSWNGNTPKYDIRDWSPDHSRMLKGITLSREDAEALCRMLIECGLSKTEEHAVEE